MGNNNKEKIAIVGMSAWYPGSKNLLELWENILSKRVQFRMIPKERLPLDEYYDENINALDKTYANRAAVIDGYDFNWIEKRIPKQTYKATDPVQWLALDMTIKMFEDANIDVETLNKEMTGVILGNTMVGDVTRPKYFRARWPFIRKALRVTAEKSGMSINDILKLEENMERVFKSVFETTTEDTMAGELSNTIAGRISNYFNLQGGGHTVDGACSSSLVAIITASDRLLSGDLDFAIAGGVDLSLDTFELIGFSKMGALSRTEMRVYDSRGDGFIAGEGCGIIGLKRLSDAKRDGNKVYATLDGWGISSDGKSGIATPTIDGQLLSLQRAYKKANIDPKEIDFIEGHGTGTKVGDYIELATIAEALDKDKVLDPSSFGVTSFKSIVGHTKAASGVGGLIKTAIALNQRVMPPIASCEVPHGLFSTKAKVLYPLIEGEKKPYEEHMKAGVSSMGFGGINTHVVLSSADKPYNQFQSSLSEEMLLSSGQDNELFIFSAKSYRLLKMKIIDIIEEVEYASYAEIVDIAKNYTLKVDNDDCIRAAIIVTTPFNAVKNLRKLVEILSTEKFTNSIYEDEEKEIFISKEVIEKDIGFIFPGQGSQQINSARNLIKRYKWAKVLLEEAKNIFKKYNKEHILNAMFVNTEELSNFSDINETEIAQPVIVLSSIFWYEHMIRIGIKPTVVSGHSLGELTAFYSAGCFSFREVMEIAIIRGQAMSASDSSAGTMASLMCNEADADRLISKVETGYLQIANLNSPKQTVVSGEKNAIDELINLALQKGVRAIELPVSNAFHSKIVGNSAKKLKKKFPASSKISILNKEIISSTNGKIIQKNIDLKEHFSQQIVNKVDFIATSKALTSSVDIILEVGPSAVLSKLIKANKEKARVYPISNNPKSFKDLNTILAVTFVNGLKLNWDYIYSNRLIREFVSADKLNFITNPCEYEFSKESISAIEKLDLNIGIENQPLVDKVSLENKSVKLEPSEDIDFFSIDILLQNASKMTGFPLDSLSGAMHLLDDLNLDSIKAGELIASVTMQLNITKEIDPMSLSGLSIEGIASYLDSLKPKIDEPSKKKDTDSLALESSNNLWVRSFKMKKTLNALNKNFHKISKESINILFPGSVGILYEESSFVLAESLKKELDIYGIESVLSTYREYSNIDNNIIAILPKPDKNMIFEESSIFNALEYLSIPLKVPLNSVTYIQFDSPLFQNNNIADIQSGCANAYVSSAHFEHKSTRMRVLDYSSTLNNKIIIDTLICEQLAEDKYIFSSYDVDGLRYINKPDLYEVKLEKRRNYELSHKDVIIVTGGAKGITAECALALALKTGAKMALVGSTLHPKELDQSSEVAQTFSKFKKHGIKYKYYSCNISNRNEVIKLVKNIESDLGEISCIVHGAGINNFGRASGLDIKKSSHDVAPKILGIMNLCQALNKNKLKLIVGLSSIIGVTGMPGNSVYGFSNEALNIVLHNYQKVNPQTEIISIAYSIWAEVGMGTKMGSTKTLEKMGIYPIPVAKGVEHFLRLIEYKSQDTLVVVSSKLGGLDTWKSQKFMKPKANRFVENIIQFDKEIELISKVHLSLENDRYLRDHKYRNIYLMPTVFGLEAMGQAVAVVLGKNSLDEGVIIEDIVLQNPIIVNENTGMNIYIKAEVLERNDFESVRKVQVYISTSSKNFSAAEFSALFILKTPKVKKNKKFIVPTKISSIKPKKDLYGNQLFQGEIFQRIEEVYSMSDQNVLCKIDFSPVKNAFSENFSPELILGNPSARDAMLQTAQLTESKMYLPVKIMQLNVYPSISKSSYYVYTQVIERLDKEIQHKVSVMDTYGNIVEELNGYISKQVGKNKIFAEPEDFMLPEKNDQLIFNIKLNKIKEIFDLDYPKISLFYNENFLDSNKEYRHKVEQDLLDMHYVPEKKNNLKKAVLKWNSVGKPSLNTNDFISFSHNQGHVLLTTGRMDQGCDIEMIENRSIEEWNRLLGKHNILIARLKDAGDTLNQAGTRIWSVLESFLKGYTEVVDKIKIVSSQDEVVLFKVFSKTEAVDIITFKINFTRNTEKLVALIVESKGAEKKHLHKIPSDMAEDEKNNFEGFNEIFKVSFKDSTLLQKLVDYTMFASWMGKLRESALSEIGEKIVKDSCSGKYAWVTNHSNIEVYKTVESFDMIEGKVWTSKRFGSKDSSNVLHFEWNKINNVGIKERVAYCEMSTTWVVIKEHGVVEAAPYPKYLDEFMSKIETSQSSKKSSEQLEENKPKQESNLALSKNILYRAKNEPIIKPLLHTELVQTTMEHANLIGNVYFAHYYEWQKLCIDRYLFNIVPDYFKGIGEKGELFVIHSEVNHLREAMPFYTIKITMHLKVLHENGMEFSFNYYGMASDNKEWVKLANGTCHGVWGKKIDNKMTAIEVPSSIINFMGNNYNTRIREDLINV